MKRQTRIGRGGEKIAGNIRNHSETSQIKKGKKRIKPKNVIGALQLEG